MFQDTVFRKYSFFYQPRAGEGTWCLITGFFRRASRADFAKNLRFYKHIGLKRVYFSPGALRAPRAFFIINFCRRYMVPKEIFFPIRKDFFLSNIYFSFISDLAAKEHEKNVSGYCFSENIFSFISREPARQHGEES